MVKPLVSVSTVPPKSMQFAHFGVLNAGAQSKASVFTSVTLNIIIALIVIILGAAAKKTMDNQKRLTSVSLVPVKKPEPKPEPPKIAPKPLPKLPEIAKIEPPKIKLPDVKIPEPPKVQPIKMAQPMPVVMPAPVRRVIAPAAPQVVSLAHPQAASVVNNSAHPSAVQLGHPDSPVAISDRPAVDTKINLGRGLPGMSAANSGGGPPSRVVVLGSGSPGSGSLTGNGVRPVAGVRLGVVGGTPGGTGNGTGLRPQQVALGAQPIPPIQRPVAAATNSRAVPKVTFKPHPEYTDEAKALHVEGNVSLRIRVSPTGAVEVLNVVNGLGHGLDQSAIRVAQGMHFLPAIDAAGAATSWEGIVNVTFQMAG